MLTRDEKSIARTLFKLKIYESDGQSFENLFTAIMNYAEPNNFQQIRPWGNIGDRKNDGYIKSKGIFYQVFAPEDSRKSYPTLIVKLKTDFSGLLKQWSPVNEFYFVVNDKYKGVNADSEQIITKLIADNKLKAGGFFTANKLEDKLFSLNDDQITQIVGCIPDPAALSGLNFSILDEVIVYIRSLSLALPVDSEIKLPNWEAKIQFNDLPYATALRLNNGAMQLNDLQQFLDNQSNFLADFLRDKINEIYIAEKQFYTGDELFWKIVNTASPKANAEYQAAVIVIMAKYFESCDIFERPTECQNDSTD
jgi:hypothetical protein